MLSGEHMTKMHKEGYGNAPLMSYTHELGKAILQVASDLEGMNTEDINTPDGMKMHHMHIALNHALEMAAEGSNLVMMGQMGMSKEMDRHTVDHGRQMVADGEKLWKDIMSSSAMSQMHMAGMTPQGSASMGATHNLAEKEKKVLDLLVKMPAMK